MSSPPLHQIIPVIIESHDDGFTATTPHLSGCIAQGETPEDALQDFMEAFAALKRTYEAENMDMPWRDNPEIPEVSANIRIVMMNVER